MVSLGRVTSAIVAGQKSAGQVKNLGQESSVFGQKKSSRPCFKE